MTLDEILDRLESLLKEERIAIRRLDGRAVAEFADDKERLVEVLRASDLNARPDLGPRMKTLGASLRHNGVLLAHARECIEEALGVLGGTSERPKGRLGVRISVSG